MTKVEKEELRNLISDACQEWFSQDDEELWDQNQKDADRVEELLEMIPLEE